MIYLDNAATTLHKPKEVIEAVTKALNTMGNAGRGQGDASLVSARTIYDTRELLANFFGGKDAREIVFTSNSTESLNIAIKGLLVPGDHVITTVLEHNSVLRPLYEMREKGIELSFIGADEKGNIQIEDIENSIKENTKLIVTTHASNLTGNVVDVKKIGDLAKSQGILYLVDASQTAGVYPIDVRKMNIDLLAFTGHKGLLGPQGTGGLLVREGVEVLPLLSGGTGVQTFLKTQPLEMPTRLEAGTLNGHGIAGLHAGVEYINRLGMDKIREKELALMWQFYHGIEAIEGIKIYGDFDTDCRTAVVSLNFKDYGSGEFSEELLEEYQITTRAGGHCAPLYHEHFKTKEQGMVRFSFSHFNTKEEVEMAIKAIKEMTN